MVNEGFCGPCQRMLADENIATRWQEAQFHHHDGDSFRQAMDMGCPICCRSWVAFNRPYILGPTRCYVWTKNVSNIQDLDRIALVHYKPPDNDQPGASQSCRFWSDICGDAEIFLQPWSIEHAQMIATGNATNGSDTWLAENTGSHQSLDFLASKFKLCVSQHRRCWPPLTERTLPTRLLDVGKEEVGPIRLVEKGVVPQGSTYSTISHCWGGSVPLKLTKSTEAMLYSGIAVGQLPKTFQDAVVVARRLDIQYLWIDSLCIYQDSIDDWSREAATMHNVYENAILNIAATASVNSHGGLFRDRNPREEEPFKIDVAWRFLKARSDATGLPLESFLCFQKRSPRILIDSAPLNHRAWVTQERLLSRRIVHCTSTLLFWECCETFANEIHRESLPDKIRGNPFDSIRILKILMNPPVEKGGDGSNVYKPYPKERLYKAWQAFRKFYSACSLSHEEDRLVAITGIVGNLSGILQDELVAGLWNSRLLKELCWSVPTEYDGPQSDSWLAPSWSWASFHDIAPDETPKEFDTSMDIAEVVHVDAQTEQSGALKTGVLTLRCRPVAALLKEGAREVFFPSDGVHLQQLTEYCPWSFMDRSHHAGGHRNILLVALVKDEYNRFGYEKFRGLILVSSAKDSTAFERIGMFDELYNDEDPCDSFVRQFLTRYEDAEEQVITII